MFRRQSDETRHSLNSFTVLTRVTLLIQNAEPTKGISVTPKETSAQESPQPRQKLVKGLHGPQNMRQGRRPTSLSPWTWPYSGEMPTRH